MRCTGFSLRWLLLLRSTASRRVGFSSCSAQASVVAASRISSCNTWAPGHTGLVALRHVGSSQTRDQTRVPCIGRWILNHCATREVPTLTFFKTFLGGTSLVVQWLRIRLPGFPGGAVVENLPANAGDTGSSPGLGRSHMPRSN